MSNPHTSYIDHEVIGEDQQTIGTITDVIYSHDDDDPTWLVVKPGLLQAERYVPIAGSYESVTGDVVVPFDRRWVKSAPKAGDHILTPAIEAEAIEHYHVPAGA